MRKPIQTLLGFLVVSLHLGVLVYVQTNKPKTTSLHKRLVVKTDKSHSKPPKEIEAKKAQITQPIAKKLDAKPPPKTPVKPKTPTKPKPPPKTPVKPKTSTKPQQKTTAKPKPTVKKKETPPPVPKKQEPQISQKLWDQVEEALAQIEKSEHSKPSKKSLEVPVLAPPSESTQLFDESAYQEKLISCLHRSLSLPEHGDVTMEIVLAYNGSVLELKVLKAESDVNRSYLEKNVPKVSFPPLDASLLKTEQKRFVLTFCNEI